MELRYADLVVGMWVRSTDGVVYEVKEIDDPHNVLLEYHISDEVWGCAIVCFAKECEENEKDRYFYAFDKGAEITQLSKELQAYKEVLRGAEAVLRQCLYGYSELLGCKTCSLCDSADDSVNDSIDSVTALLSKIDSMNKGE